MSSTAVTVRPALPGTPGVARTPARLVGVIGVGEKRFCVAPARAHARAREELLRLRSRRSR